MIAAAFAYGRVDLINQTVRTLLEALGPRPRQALEAGRHLEPGFLPGFRYRFNRTSDCVGLCHSLAEMVREHGSLGASLVIRRADVPTFDEALARWVVDLRDRASLVAPRSRGLHFLLPDPSLGGVCKRWRLFLRWMIRPADGTDLGLWHGLLSPAELTLPLDAHWTRIGPRLGWTQRRTPGRGMAEDLTRALRKYAPEDPLRYDFAICHLGISGACPPKLELRHCLACPLAFLCRTGRTRVGRHRSSLRGAPPLG